MRVHLVVEMIPGVDPVSAARVFSELPKVAGVMSIVDGRELEFWRGGVHVASNHGHPAVDRARRAMDVAREAPKI